MEEQLSTLVWQSKTVNSPEDVPASSSLSITVLKRPSIYTVAAAMSVFLNKS